MNYVSFPKTKEEFPVCLMSYGQGDSTKRFEITLPISNPNVPDVSAVLTCTSPDLKDTIWQLSILGVEKPVGDPDHLRVKATGTLTQGSFAPQKIRHGKACEKAIAFNA